MMLDARPKAATAVTRGELTDGEVVISVPGGKQAVILNAVGDAVFELCDGSRTVADIAGVLKASLQVPEGVDVARDVGAVLDELVRAGLVEATE
jgi:hypothetical protein